MEDERALSKKSKHLLKELTIKKANYILSKPHIHEEDVYDLIKEFFKEFLQVKYEFTMDELVEELKKIYLETHVWKKLKPFLDRISVIEYSDKKYTEEDLKDLIRYFLHLLGIIITTKLPKKLAWHKRLKSLITRKKDQDVEELEDVRINTAEVNEIYDEVENAFVKATDEQEKISRVEASEKGDIRVDSAEISAMEEMNSLIKEITKHLDNNKLKKAKELYKKLQKVYDSTENETKKDYYEIINTLYAKLS